MPTKGLTIGDVLGLSKRKPHGQTRGLKHFAPGGLCAPDDGPDAAQRFPEARTVCPKCERVSINTTCPKCVVPTTPAPFRSTADIRAASDRFAAAAGPEQINSMTFGEQFVELLGEFIDAREQYAHSRRGAGGEYANPDDMNRASDRLQALLDKRLP